MLSVTKFIKSKKLIYFLFLNLIACAGIENETSIFDSSVNENTTNMTKAKESTFDSLAFVVLNSNTKVFDIADSNTVYIFEIPKISMVQSFLLEERGMLKIKYENLEGWVNKNDVFENQKRAIISDDILAFSSKDVFKSQKINLSKGTIVKLNSKFDGEWINIVVSDTTSLWIKDLDKIGINQEDFELNYLANTVLNNLSEPSNFQKLVEIVSNEKYQKSPFFKQFADSLKLSQKEGVFIE